MPRGKWDAERARLREQMREAGLKSQRPAKTAALTAKAETETEKVEAEADTVDA